MKFRTLASLTITARAGSAADAAALANAVAHAIEDESTVVPSNDESLIASVETIRKRILGTEAEYERLLAIPPPLSDADTAALGNALTLLHELTNVYDSLNAALNKTPSGLAVVDAADPQFAEMIAPRTAYYILLAAVAGLILAAGIASALDHLDDTVKSPDDVNAVADLRTLGTVGSCPEGQASTRAPWAGHLTWSLSQASRRLTGRSGPASSSPRSRCRSRRSS